jgi:hypothetical protein
MPGNSTETPEIAERTARLTEGRRGDGGGDVVWRLRSM